jgi:hypothetical protein
MPLALWLSRNYHTVSTAINTVIKENQQNSIFLRADNLFKAKLVGDA